MVRAMTEDELKSILAAHARDFANAIVDLIRNAPMKELMALEILQSPEPAEVEIAEPPPPPPIDETELSILEHLNGAGPKGSTLRAWIISEQGELDGDEHAEWEAKAQPILDKLVTRGTITAKDGGKMRGTVYTLAPAA